MKKAFYLKFFGVLSLMFIIPTISLASEFRRGDFVKVPVGEVVDGNLYTAATDINIEGEITGDLICATAKLNVSGKVGGDIICATSDSDISGEVGASVRLLSNNTKISGLIANNIFLVSQKLYLEDVSVVGRDLLFAGDEVYSSGKIGGDIWGLFSKLEIKGEVKKNLNIRMDDQINKDEVNLKIYPEAKVGGDVNYTGLSQAQYEIGSVSGQVIHNTPEKKTLDFFAWLKKHLYKIFSALVIALLLSFWLKSSLSKITTDLQQNFWQIFWPGILFIFLPPIAFIFLLITIIGIPLGLIVLVIWIPVLYVAQVLTAMVLGQALLLRFKKNKANSPTVAIIIGVPLLWLLYGIPFFGFFIAFMACVIGLGLIWHYIKKYYHNK
jgi:hypothetical protein